MKEWDHVNRKKRLQMTNEPIYRRRQYIRSRKLKQKFRNL